MNRIALMVLRNIHKVPGAYSKLCRYARNPENYAEAEMYGHIQYILQQAIKGGNVSVEVHGKENIPAENAGMGKVILLGDGVELAACTMNKPLKKGKKVIIAENLGSHVVVKRYKRRK